MKSVDRAEDLNLIKMKINEAVNVEILMTENHNF